MEELREGVMAEQKKCPYMMKLDDVNLSVLEDLVKQSVEHTNATYKSA